MAFVIADRVREVTNSTGTGSVTLAGAYVSFQTFSAAIGNSNSTYYTIASATSGQWEVGIGTYTAASNTLSRDTILSSSNAGAIVNFSEGLKDVFVTQPSERSLLVNSASSGLYAGSAAFTANGIPYASSTSALATTSNLTFNGSTQVNLGFGIGLNSWNAAYSRYVVGVTTLAGANNSSVSHLTSNLYDSGAGTGAWQYMLFTTNRGSVLTQFGGTLTWSATPAANTAGNPASLIPILQASYTRTVTLNASGTPGALINYGTAEITGNVTLSGGTANGVTYLNGSKVLTSGTALTYNGNTLGLYSATAGLSIQTSVNTNQAVITLADADGRTAVFRSPNSGSPNLAQIGTTTNHDLAFLYGNAEQMRLTSTGLGIGTSSPTAKLDVNGGTNSEMRLTTSGSGYLQVGQFTNGAFIGTSSTDATAGILRLGTGGTTRATIDSAGNLGLGVTPSAWGTGPNIKAFDVGAVGSFAGSDGSADVIANAYYDGAKWVYKTTAPAARYQILAVTGAHEWATAPSGTAGTEIVFSQRMTLDASGLLTVGNTAPAGASQITAYGSGNGQIAVQNSTNWSRLLQNSGDLYIDNGVGGSAGNIIFRNSSSTIERARIDATGNLSMAASGAITSSRINPRPSSSATPATITPDIQAADQYSVTALANALTINAPTGTPVDGNKLMFRLLDNGTARALTWNATYTAIGVTLPTTTVINKTTYVGCIYNANNTRWDVIAVTTQA